MSTHTPGPLTVGFYEPTHRFLAVAEHYAVMRPDGSLVAVTGPTNGTDAAQSHADAVLFALAPDLLALVRRMLPLLKNGTEPENAKFLGNIWADAAMDHIQDARALLATLDGAQ